MTGFSRWSKRNFSASPPSTPHRLQVEPLWYDEEMCLCTRDQDATSVSTKSKSREFIQGFVLSFFVNKCHQMRNWVYYLTVGVRVSRGGSGGTVNGSLSSASDARLVHFA